MIELLRNRRSIRKYTDKDIEPEKVEILKEAVLRSPSSRNFDPWEFIFVDDQELLKQLALCKPHGAKFLEGAALGIVICADGQKSDVWIEDCSIASILVQMAAQSIGLGSCWIQIRNRMFDDQMTSENYIKDLLKIPDNFKVESIIAVGYPAEKREPVLRENLKYEKLRFNSY
ncbi:MAG: NAD(P)H-dependent dehydrogenase/reductase [Phycisphaerae bacterium]|nr:NAD(P)H-dependent dehydrogenase/reductase [Phycisphaerae bacterium]NIP51357.1 NAD(P)H-dependent dehydrogenase/reductase [Phycisphaerae bacterium]NIS50552.1 NAD(P)H-dependent dehydrogenase/reductase [Phycisphaerae bacterium]NIU08286.1 NAD(P)H-dependent dehydrogenase/reductase [Phycisphaerae bacterium]NIU55782.1 NAD(P)H-dependent dehydrogenase/reductase [Phycisphaerae bacterium]